jgi:hypothetical protein
MTAAAGALLYGQKQGNPLPQLIFSPQGSMFIDSENGTQNITGATTAAV